MGRGSLRRNSMKTVILIEDTELESLVKGEYNRPWSFQQQDGCKDRGVVFVTVPSPEEDYENSTVPEIVNGDEMGVSFRAWKERDPNLPLEDREDSKSSLHLWWERNFYPDISMIVNDLHRKGLLPAGDYAINIDW